MLSGESKSNELSGWLNGWNSGFPSLRVPPRRRERRPPGLPSRDAVRALGPRGESSPTVGIFCDGFIVVA